MNFRLTIALLLVLAALGGALAFADQQKKTETKPDPEQQQLQIFDLKATDVVGFEIYRGSETWLFQKDDSGEWVLQPKGETADQAGVIDLVSRLATLRGTRHIAAEEASVDEYGLNEPRLTVKLELNDGASHTLRVGEKTPVQTGHYAQADDHGDAYVLPNTLITDLERLIEQPLAPTPTLAPTATPTVTPTPAPTAPPISEPSPSPTP